MTAAHEARHDGNRSRPCGALLSTIAFVTLAAVACSTGRGREADGPSPAATVGASGPDTVEVVLLEYVIDMPTTLPPGPTVLRIVNEGMEDHNFLVARDGVRSGIHDAIPPGGIEHLTLDLAEGAFTALCTWASHDAKGMFERVEVVPSVGRNIPPEGPDGSGS